MLKPKTKTQRQRQRPNTIREWLTRGRGLVCALGALPPNRCAHSVDECYTTRHQKKINNFFRYLFSFCLFLSFNLHLWSVHLPINCCRCRIGGRGRCRCRCVAVTVSPILRYYITIWTCIIVRCNECSWPDIRDNEMENEEDDNDDDVERGWRRHAKKKTVTFAFVRSLAIGGVAVVSFVDNGQLKCLVSHQIKSQRQYFVHWPSIYEYFRISIFLLAVIVLLLSLSSSLCVCVVWSFECSVGF